MAEYAAPDESLAQQLATLVKDALLTDQPLKARLFTNNIDPQPGVTVADFTEATFTGYSERVLARADWGEATVDDDHVARIRLAAGPMSWTPTGALQTVYGVFLVNADASRVVWARPFATPRALEAGVPLEVNVVLTVRSEVYV